MESLCIEINIRSIIFWSLLFLKSTCKSFFYLFSFSYFLSLCFLSYELIFWSRSCNEFLPLFFFQWPFLWIEMSFVLLHFLLVCEVACLGLLQIWACIGTFVGISFCYGSKVIIHKSRSGKFLRNRNWDLGWFWARRQYWKKIWCKFEPLLRSFFHVFSKLF